VSHPRRNKLLPTVCVQSGLLYTYTHADIYFHIYHTKVKLLNHSEILVSHDSNCEGYYLKGCDAMASDGSLLSFWSNILTPSSELKSKPGKQTSKIEK
jgi:hypothetical protein